jgi:hypothetical protein
MQTAPPTTAPPARKRTERSPHSIHRDFRLPVLLCKFSGRRYLCWTLLSLLMVVGRVALLPILPSPQPVVHDEFSYLLAGDTFAHGRLANPTPPLPEFFESLHIMVRPVYASKYPPGQGLLLALGQKVTGNPYWGVVLSGAVMVFLFCWSADAWLPPQWALIAGGLSAVLFFVRHYWFESYWGGALAASGGALIVGSLGYVLRNRFGTARFGFAAGAILLYLSRPFEGAVLSLAAFAVLAIHFWRIPGAEKRALTRTVILPNLAVMLAAAAPAAWYNAKVTGHATLMPYVLYQRQYDMVTWFWTLPPLPEKEYSSAYLRGRHQAIRQSYKDARLPRLYQTLALHLAFVGIGAVWLQFLAFGLLLLGVPWARMHGRKKWLLLLATAGVAALVQEVLTLPHYTAPFTPVVLILIVAGGRALWYRVAGIRLRGPLTGLAMAVFFIFVVVDYANAFHPTTPERARMIRQLSSMGGRHVVFVNYLVDQYDEWIYNSADLETSPILFVLMRSEQENRTLLDRFPGRTAWLVTIGPLAKAVRWEPYPAPR